jgi:hypothetical protein
MYWIVYQTIIEEQSFDASNNKNTIRIGTYIRKVEANSEAEAIGKFIIDTKDVKAEKRVDPIACFEFDCLKTI